MKILLSSLVMLSPLTDQRAMEDADDISFDEYLQNYLAQKP